MSKLNMNMRDFVEELIVHQKEANSVTNVSLCSAQGSDLIGYCLHQIWLISTGGGRFRLHRNVKEIGLIKLSAVNNSTNKRREYQMRNMQVSKHCYVQEELSIDSALPILAKDSGRVLQHIR
jgi:pantothenate kinase